MEIFDALLALCAGNSSLTSSQRPVTPGFGFDVSFDLRLNKNGWINSQDAGD